MCAARSIARCYCLRAILLEKLILEDEQVDHSYRDIGIGNIKYRTEEVAIPADKEAEHLGTVLPLEERQVYHIYNLAHEQSPILSIEKYAIEKTINHIAYSSCQDEHRTYDDTLGHAATTLKEIGDAVYQRTNHNKTEDAQYELTPINATIGTAELHAKGKTIILDIAEVKPTKDLNLVAHLKVEVNKHLNNLVDNDK